MMQTDTISEADLMRLWNVNPSELEDYHRNYSTETPEGDLITVDYNYPRQMVRISLKLAREGHREYISVIKSGTVLQEREVLGRRSLDLTHKFHELDTLFALIPDENLLATINGNYGLPLQNKLPVGRSYHDLFPVHPLRQRFSILRWIRAYLKNKRAIEQAQAGFFRKFIRRLPAELLDLSLGCLLIWAAMQNLLDMTELAGYAGSLALLSGAWDWVWRQRNPFLPKVLTLMAISLGAVYFQIQYRMWAIFL